MMNVQISLPAKQFVIIKSRQNRVASMARQKNCTVLFLQKLRQNFIITQSPNTHTVSPFPSLLPTTSIHPHYQLPQPPTYTFSEIES